MSPFYEENIEIEIVDVIIEKDANSSEVFTNHKGD